VRYPLTPNKKRASAGDGHRFEALVLAHGGEKRSWVGAGSVSTEPRVTTISPDGQAVVSDRSSAEVRQDDKTGQIRQARVGEPDRRPAPPSPERS
jgi:hypothetical protein